jgi:diguanylate cyclase (GGDEF)-like protein
MTPLKKISKLFGTDTGQIKQDGNLASVDTMQLFRHIPIEIAIFDTDGKYRYANPKYIGDAELRKSVLGKDDTFYFEKAGFSPEGLETRRYNFERVLKEKRIIRFTEKLFVPRRNKNLYYKRSYQPIFSDSRQEKLSGICMFGSDLTAVIHGQQELKYLAFHDKLTGLLNRDGFYQQLDQILLDMPRDTEKRSSAILFCDLDNFKLVNDTLGHDIGDMVLREVALRLVKSLRKSDYVFRLGGDEFTVIIRHLKHDYESSNVAEKIITSLTEPFVFGEHKINYISTSIGIVTIPKQGGDRESLVKNADTAMYAAKKNGKNQYQYFKEDMGDESLRRIKIENNLKTMVRGKSFEQECSIVYQPIVEKTEENKFNIIGAEALMRWSNPELGPVAPETFIPIAEETNLISPMGEWVFYKTCRDIAPIVKNHRSDFYISINLSALQLRSADIAIKIRQMLEMVDLKPQNVQLELTETSYIEDRVEISQNMMELNDMGIRLAIDDFGIGFASLVYLQRIPASTIKIDRSFVQHVDTSDEHRQLVKSIIHLGMNLDKDVIAEGVEKTEHLEFLTNEQCNKFQGYLFSKPLTFSKFKGLLNQEHPFEYRDIYR